MRILWAGMLALTALAACTFSQPSPGPCREEIAVFSFPAHKELGSFTLPRDGRFSLSFIHSVSHTPVRDDYLVKNGKVVQTSEIFETHGAGLPASLEEPDITGWKQEKGKFIIYMNRDIARLIVRTNRLYKNRLHLAESKVDLNQWKDQALELTIRPCRP